MDTIKFNMKTVIPINIVTLGEENSYHLFINGFINGNAYDMLIDTGASHTIFDAALIPEIDDNEGKRTEIQSAGINAGELKSSIGRIHKFRLGGLRRKNWNVVLIDLSHVNGLYEKLLTKHVAGLIGSDFLLQYNAIIDYKKKELILRNIKKDQ